MSLGEKKNIKFTKLEFLESTPVNLIERKLNDVNKNKVPLCICKL